jgi:hypothetical protein
MKTLKRIISGMLSKELKHTEKQERMASVLQELKARIQQ